MEVMYKICCGLDVHKKVIVACILSSNDKQIKSFGTMTEDIFELINWIKQNNCECVAMESTGVFWKPIYNLLEVELIPTLVVNARHIKNVPGRKTDVKDSEWIANLLKHGLLQGSYIPSRDQRELRELVRYRRSLIDERSREANRLQKVLEGANIKLSSVASNVLGASGRAMIKALISGVDDPVVLAELSKSKLRNKKDLLQKSLRGLIGHHQKMLLTAQLKHIDFLAEQIENITQEVSIRLDDSSELIELLDTVPGIAEKTAQDILAEIGTNMDQFPTAQHLASWAGMVPGNNESAGKKKLREPVKVINH